jgi:hypothetical protein
VEGDQARLGLSLRCPGSRQATSTRSRSAIKALVVGGCTSAETLTCLTNAAEELARGVRGRGRDGGDDARAALDKRLFDSRYDDVEILGKLVTRGDAWQPIGFALHVQNGAILGAGYARLKPSLPGPAVLRGLLAGLIQHVATWPMTVLVDRYHPARKELPKLAANTRAFGQATIRHAVFGVVLGLLEAALNDRSA